MQSDKYEEVYWRKVIERARETLMGVPARYNLILTTESWQEIDDAAAALQGLLDVKTEEDEEFDESLADA